MANAVEFSLRILPLNDTLPQELEKLAAEGWQPVPNLAAAATYVMFRDVVQQAAATQAEPEVSGLGKLTIDETKVHIYRNGRLVEIGEERNG
jgi:hypothetical protein